MNHGDRGNGLVLNNNYQPHALPETTTASPPSVMSDEKQADSTDQSSKQTSSGQNGQMPTIIVIQQPVQPQSHMPANPSVYGTGYQVDSYNI